MEPLYRFDEWTRERFNKDFLMVTKNGKVFDIPFVLARCSFKGISNDIRLHVIPSHFKDFDLQELTRKWISLDDLAALRAIEGKTGTGLNAIRLFREGRYDESRDYCEQDVRVTEKVFLRVMQLKSGRGDSK